MRPLSFLCRRPARGLLTLLLVCVTAVAVPQTTGAATQVGTLSRLWATRYNGPGDAYDAALATAVSPDGATAFVTGVSNGSGTRIDYATVAYDVATGTRRWVARYDGPGNDDDYAAALATSPDGTVFVTGESFGTSNDYATVAYDGVTGARRWVARYDGPGRGSDWASALGISPDGATVFVTGYATTRTGTSYDYATVAYDASTGARRWVTRYNGPVDANDYAHALGVSPDGATVFVTGGSPGSGTFDDYATVAYDASTGTRRWVARYNGPGSREDQPRTLAVSSDGARVYVTGRSWGSGTSYDYGTVAYDALTGAQRWLARYDDAGNNYDDAQALGVSPDGTAIFVTGYSNGRGTASDYGTVAYEAATGARRWVARYAGPGKDYDFARALGMSSDGATVFVAGHSRGSGYGTVVYAASTGHQLGLARTGPGTAFAMEVTPDGKNLIVTGTAGPDASGSDDFGTVAYRLVP